ncbi:SNF serine/threonine-protein kinase [Fasciola hepatica]|uniref:SNF-related serine/threonine-protein kinase n=1 Tax=Fasciola hepatica TaxID=6192 RepID=A0A4E0S2J2_FASHE|nr:SNF serine/threonine-protein kinase [Fasciola hepatica]
MAVANKLFYYAPDNDTKIAGLYDLQHTIGRGHYAVVKLARHVFTGEKVAVKVIDKTKLDNVAQDHLFQEVVCMKLVQHPNVVRLYEVIDTPNTLYLILELGDGGDLYDYIMKHGSGLNERLAKRYFRQIVTAIAYCHKLHVVHRDLKPENVVFFEKLGLVKLTDFGFSNRFTPGTHLDTACGSLAYSAPEILLGDSYDAPKVDIWSLGVILYMLVCGRLPFQETNDSETLTKIMDCEYTIPDYLSSECANLIQRLLIRDPAKRAHLDDVLQADWLRIDDDDLPIELFSVPLVSREYLSFEDHMEILSKMSEGQLATVDEIQATLDRNEYNHIAATYFLLAERKLKRNYIEEYKRLSHQAQQIERLKQQQQPQAQPLSPAQQSGQHSLADTQISQVTGKVSPWGVCAVSQTSPIALANNPEERIRRFSMILEDEEEEQEEEEECTEPPSTFSRYLAEEYRNLCLPDGELHVDMHPLETCLEESSNEALIEEEEELVTVASLACVRSDLAAEQQSSVGTINTLLADGGHAAGMMSSVTRPCSRASGLVMDTSDGAESDASLSNRSTSGGSYTGPAHQPIISRSLPPGDNRRKPHYRRGTVPHRPLISVKSSPQLLKHIAEEEWSSASALDRNGNFSSNHLVHEYERTNSSNHSKNTLSDDSGGTHSLRASFKRQRALMSFDDQLVGTRPRFSFSTPRPLSTTHSPTRTRRFFTSAGNRSRPTSVGSWSAAVSLSLLRDMRRQSVGSSPVDTSFSGAPARRRPLALTTHSQIIQQMSRNQLADRRCSGPPSITLTMSNIYPTAMMASSPRRCGSDNSFADGPEPSSQPVGPDLTSSDHVRNVRGMRPEIIPRAVSESDTTAAVEDKSISLVNGICNGISESHSPSHSNTDPRYNSAQSPHHALSTVQRTSDWCSSAPMLCDTRHTSYGIDVSAWASGTSTLTNIGNSSTLPGTQSVREHCAPIREEDDEISRSGDLARIDSSTHCFTFGPRRRSESSGVRATSSLLTDSDLSKAAFAALADAETYSTLKQHSETSVGGAPLSVLADHRNHPPLTTGFISGVGPGGQSSNLTTSNFSLSSLATSLRGSRHMLDVIRGTFELQCHYQRRTANSATGSSIGGYSSARASASDSVRSLTAISESIPISTGLVSDLPGRYSQRPAPYTRFGLSPDPLSSYPCSRANTITGSRRVLSPPRRSLVVATPKGPVTSAVNYKQQFHHGLIHPDRFSMPAELTEMFYLDHLPTSRLANESTLNTRNWSRRTTLPAERNVLDSGDESKTPHIGETAQMSSNKASTRVSPTHFSVAHNNTTDRLHPKETAKPSLLTTDCFNTESATGKQSNRDSSPPYFDNQHVTVSDSKPRSGPIPVSVSMVTFDSDGDLMTINDYRPYNECGNGRQQQINNNHRQHHTNNNNSNNNNGYQKNNNTKDNSITHESHVSYHEDADSTANLCSSSLAVSHSLVPKCTSPKQLIPILTAHKTHSKLSCCTIS